MKEKIRKILINTGAKAVGFASAGEIDNCAHEYFKTWVEEGFHGEMAYLERHIPLRHHTDHVLEGAKTVISLAFSYVPEKWRPINLPMIAAYAYGDDYHKVIRKILRPAVRQLQELFGGKWRICVDSAPVAERFWALKSGIAKKAVNNCVIVEGCGGLCFLAEILTTIVLDPDQSSTGGCLGCGACIKACPAKALSENGHFDARKCINYLMIEKKSVLTPEEKSLIDSGAGHIYGCDRCLRVCPHNKDLIPSNIPEFVRNSDIP